MMGLKLFVGVYGAEASQIHMTAPIPNPFETYI
jgi:hypothetical protein